MDPATTTKAPLNPYVVGGALSEPTGRGFYGREDVFNFVRSGLAVEQRSPILLYGQRRVGKSSILRQLPNHLPGDLVCVYFDLQGKASMELDQVLFGLARAIAERLKLPKPTREESTEETFRSQFFARAVAALDQQPGRLVLLFDEFDVVDEKLVNTGVAARRFISYLSELTAAEPQLGCILVVGRKTEELSTGFNAALLKDSIQHKIGRLEEADCSRLVVELAVGYLQFHPAALRAIYRITAGHPYCTQVLCNCVWAKFFDPAGGRAAPIGEERIIEAVPLAIERGTAGLNWSFDGITQPAQRLFLSAMAEPLELMSTHACSAAMIETLLRDRRIGVDRTELARAPEELQQWDIITKSSDGYRFSVQMIGLWIKKERPLEHLMLEVRSSNPRAYQYFELGRQAHERGDFERAILDYRGAVHAHPMFVEAHRGLATALLDSKGVDALDEAIELHERILEIDPNAGPHALLDLLSRRLDEPATVDLHLKSFDRIGQLEPQGTVISRAHRQLEQIGFAFMEQHAYREGEQIAARLNLADMAARARKRGARYRQIMMAWWACAGLPALALAILLGVELAGEPSGFDSRIVRLGLAAIGGVAVAVIVPHVLRAKPATAAAGQALLQMAPTAQRKSAGSAPLDVLRGPRFVPDLVTILAGILLPVFWYFVGWDTKWQNLILLFVAPAFVSRVRHQMHLDERKKLESRLPPGPRVPGDPAPANEAPATQAPTQNPRR